LESDDGLFARVLCRKVLAGPATRKVKSGHCGT
jgi:hypothetical protein